MIFPALRTLTTRPTSRTLLTTLRSYATSKPIPNLKKATIRPNLKTPPPQPPRDYARSFSRDQRIQQAQKLYNAGVSEVYHAPSRLLWFRIQSWAIAALCVGAVYNMKAWGMLDSGELKRRGLSMVVRVAITIAACGMLMFAGISVGRTGGHVRTVKLVREADQVFFEVGVTRKAPFVPPTKYVLPVYDLRVSYAYAGRTFVPEWKRGGAEEKKKDEGIVQFVSDGFAAMFQGARQFFSMDGQMKVTACLGGEKDVQEKKGKALWMDSIGEFHRDAAHPEVETMFTLSTLLGPGGEEMN